MTDILVLAAGWILFGIVFVAVVPTVVITMRRILPRAAGGTSLGPSPTVSVIVAARNEEPNIETAMSSLLKSDYSSLQIIAVDDRSTDRTGDILDHLADKDERLSVVHIEHLPDDWLGKNHAMHKATEVAQGEFLLFTDGDVEFDPIALRSAMEYVQRNEIDHLCVFPVMNPGSFVENSLVAFFSLCFCVGLQSWLIPTSFQFAYAGVGAFNLVRRSSYDDVGGHTTLKFDVLDDVKLGKLLKRHGAKQALLRADGLVSVRWQPSAWGVITGLEKNGFAALNYSITRLAMTTLVYFVGFLAPYAVLVVFPDLRSSGFLASILTFHLMYAVLGHCLGAGMAVFFVFPLASMGMAFAFWRSSWITLRQGGVRWRDTFYPLAVLRDRMAP